MKYSEYQIWYHVYTAVCSAMCSTNAINIVEKADIIASHALEKFKSVEDIPATQSLDIQGMVDRVIKESVKKK